MEMTTENCFQNGDENRKLFSKCMEMTTENCFQNAEQRHRCWGQTTPATDT
jgi:hypothetical protein